VGLGRFGSFAAAHLAQEVEVFGYDPSLAEGSAEALGEAGVQLGNLASAAACEVVVLAVPVQALRDTLDEIRELLQPGALVLDVCSVKSAPMRWLADALPESVDYVGSHPLFGPASAADGLEEHRVVLCPGRGQDRVDCVARFLRSIGLYVLVTDADTHDRECARGQVLAQYIGRALGALDAPDTELRTDASDLLFEIANLVGDDADELFAAIQNLNPYAAEARDELRHALAQLDEELGS